MFKKDIRSFFLKVTEQNYRKHLFIKKRFLHISICQMRFKSQSVINARYLKIEKTLVQWLARSFGTDIHTQKQKSCYFYPVKRLAATPLEA